MPEDFDDREDDDRLVRPVTLYSRASKNRFVIYLPQTDADDYETYENRGAAHDLETAQLLISSIPDAIIRDSLRDVIHFKKGLTNA